MQIEKEENASSRPRRTQALSHRRHSFHSCAGLVYNYFPFYTLLAICDNEPTSGDSLTHSLHRPRSLHVRAGSAGGALNDIIINWSVQLDRVTQHGNDECTTLCVQIDETCLDNGKNARVLFFPLSLPLILSTRNYTRCRKTDAGVASRGAIVRRKRDTRK